MNEPLPSENRSPDFIDRVDELDEFDDSCMEGELPSSPTGKRSGSGSGVELYLAVPDANSPEGHRYFYMDRVDSVIEFDDQPSEITEPGPTIVPPASGIPSLNNSIPGVNPQ